MASERGGALIAMNHTSYVDCLPASLAGVRRGRRLRFLMKAYALAVQRLREGELVGPHPEATISRRFELREFKTGAARLAHEAEVLIIPLIV
jgi:1-acyl-sn-glycerol-3-phosphate acyltransferase